MTNIHDCPPLPPLSHTRQLRILRCVVGDPTGHPDDDNNTLDKRLQVQLCTTDTPVALQTLLEPWHEHDNDDNNNYISGRNQPCTFFCNLVPGGRASQLGICNYDIVLDVTTQTTDYTTACWSLGSESHVTQALQTWGRSFIYVLRWKPEGPTAAQVFAKLIVSSGGAKALKNNMLNSTTATAINNKVNDTATPSTTVETRIQKALSPSAQKRSYPRFYYEEDNEETQPTAKRPCLEEKTPNIGADNNGIDINNTSAANEEASWSEHSDHFPGPFDNEDDDEVEEEEAPHSLDGNKEEPASTRESTANAAATQNQPPPRAMVTPPSEENPPTADKDITVEEEVTTPADAPTTPPTNATKLTVPETTPLREETASPAKPWSVQSLWEEVRALEERDPLQNGGAPTLWERVRALEEENKTMAKILAGKQSSPIAKPPSHGTTQNKRPSLDETTVSTLTTHATQGSGSGVMSPTTNVAGHLSATPNTQVRMIGGPTNASAALLLQASTAATAATAQPVFGTFVGPHDQLQNPSAPSFLHQSPTRPYNPEVDCLFGSQGRTPGKTLFRRMIRKVLPQYRSSGIAEKALLRRKVVAEFPGAFYHKHDTSRRLGLDKAGEYVTNMFNTLSWEYGKDQKQRQCQTMTETTIHAAAAVEQRMTNELYASAGAAWDLVGSVDRVLRQWLAKHATQTNNQPTNAEEVHHPRNVSSAYDPEVDFCFGNAVARSLRGNRKLHEMVQAILPHYNAAPTGVKRYIRLKVATLFPGNFYHKDDLSRCLTRKWVIDRLMDIFQYQKRRHKRKPTTQAVSASSATNENHLPCPESEKNKPASDPRVIVEGGVTRSVSKPETSSTTNNNAPHMEVTERIDADMVQDTEVANFSSLEDCATNKDSATCRVLGLNVDAAVAPRKAGDDDDNEEEEEDLLYEWI